MNLPILRTKLYIPPLPQQAVVRSSVIEQLNKGSKGKLTLISASAGFGKTTVLSQWVKYHNDPVGWIALDEEHNDPIRFILYILGALQSVKVAIDESIFAMVLSPQPPPYKTILTLLINEIANLEDDVFLILEDYYLTDSKELDDALAFLLDNMPSQMHLIISTRADPRLPLAKLRARGQMIEVRIEHMRFNRSEIAAFMNCKMGFKLIEKNISALELRTEGWVTGLQLAAISMQGNTDISGFIDSFTGSNRYIIDYLVEEVLNKLSKNVQEFLLRTSILDRMCGSLCDAIYPSNDTSGQEILEYLEKMNMFVVPLDSERCWYRYHHLFAEILRQRMASSSIIVDKDKNTNIEDLYLIASNWSEKNDFYVEAFGYATKTKNIELAQGLIKGNGIPLQFSGAIVPILDWLGSLKKEVLDANPSLWVTYASTLSMASRFDLVEDKLLAAEAALKDRVRDDFTRNLMGHIASTRAFLALIQRKTQSIPRLAKMALEDLHPDNLAVRASVTWILGATYHSQGKLDQARATLLEAIAISNATSNFVVGVSASSILGRVYEEENELHLAFTTYQNILSAQGNMLLPTSAYFSHIGLARIFYEWNDLETSLKHCLKSIELSEHLVNTDIIIICQVFLARLKLCHKDFSEATKILDKVSQTIEQNNYREGQSDVIRLQVKTLIKQGNLSEAYRLANKSGVPICLARVYLAKNESDQAIKHLEPILASANKTGHKDRKSEVLILLSLANHMTGNKEESKRLLIKALSLTEPNDFIRSYIDEGENLLEILKQISVSGKLLSYKRKILEAFDVAHRNAGDTVFLSSPQPLIEDLSKRELEVLELIAKGLSNQKIAEELFLAIDTVKGHNRRIYEKLGVNNRTSAVKKATGLGIIKR